MTRSMAPARRLEDRIRELCIIVASSSDSDLAEAVSELEAAMNEYTRRLANKTSAAVLAWPKLPAERRRKA
jgi:hypothetical protein